MSDVVIIALIVCGTLLVAWLGFLWAVVVNDRPPRDRTRPRPRLRRSSSNE